MLEGLRLLAIKGECNLVMHPRIILRCRHFQHTTDRFNPTRFTVEVHRSCDDCTAERDGIQIFRQACPTDLAGLILHAAAAVDWKLKYGPKSRLLSTQPDRRRKHALLEKENDPELRSLGAQLRRFAAKLCRSAGIPSGFAAKPSLIITEPGAKAQNLHTDAPKGTFD